MKSIRFILISTFICLTTCGCSTSRQAGDPRASDPEITPAEAYERWNPEKALREAERDIRQNTVNIFYHGGIAAFPAGVDSNDYELISDLPFADADIGCVITDGRLRRMQGEFAIIYNRRVVEWLKE